MAAERPVHLIVEKGPDQGKEISIRPEGARIGRSSHNDVVLKDPVMSRYHCRLFFKPNEGLWVEDLGSANKTLLNSAPVHMARMRPGDQLALGDTVLKVVGDEYPSSSAAQLFGASESESFAGRPEGPLRQAAGKNRKKLLAFLLAVVVVAAALALIVHFQGLSAPGTENGAAKNGQVEKLEIYYEKIQASPKNIFRYELELKNDELSVQIDDLANKRHIAKNQHKKIDRDLIASLGDTLLQSDFNSLNEVHRGSTEEVYDLLDLTITFGRKTRRVQVFNTIEPEQFQQAREAIEEFAQNEIGLAALALTREKLLELAGDSARLGRQLYEQREVKRENLSLAIRALKEAEWYLETVEPKPDYYADAVVLRRECERELEENYKNHLFLAERAVKLRDWNDAAVNLRILMEKIPDRSDERHRNVRKKLIDVERHLKSK
ncbi:MAG: FHA domain-containing protein [Kiritimatiellae bacterium]|nr:FHA domain-containing protein [Kiritimatiellia bacterium]